MTDERTAPDAAQGEEGDVDAHLLKESMALGLTAGAIFAGQAQAKVEPAPEGLSDQAALVASTNQPTGQAKASARKARQSIVQARPKPPLEP